MTLRLFSYGTLQLPAVQQAVFGRLLEGRPDKLPGYALAPLVITDAKVIETSGKAVHTIARATGQASDKVPGVVFEIEEADLQAADRYEVDAYGRVEVELASGCRAWLYVGAP